MTVKPEKICKCGCPESHHWKFLKGRARDQRQKYCMFENGKWCQYNEETEHEFDESFLSVIEQARLKIKEDK